MTSRCPARLATWSGVEPKLLSTFDVGARFGQGTYNLGMSLERRKIDRRIPSAAPFINVRPGFDELANLVEFSAFGFFAEGSAGGESRAETEHENNYANNTRLHAGFLRN